MTRFFACISVFVFLSASCKKLTLPPDKPAEFAFFYADLEFDNGGTPIRLAASEEQAYVMTASHEKDTADVLSSKMSEQWCLDQCGPSLEIQILDYSEYEGYPFSFSEAISVGDLPYVAAGSLPTVDTQGDYVYTLQAAGLNGVTYPDSFYRWDVMDTTALLPLGKEVQLVRQDSLPFSVCLNIDNGSSVLAKSCFDLRQDGISCQLQIVGLFYQAGAALWAEPRDGQLGNFLWDQGGGLNSIYVTDPGLYCVTAEDTLSSCEASACILYTADASNPFIDVFAVLLDVQWVPPSPSLRRLVLIYTDESGKVYRSDAQAQSADSYFKILGGEPYQDAGDGRNFYAVDWEARAILYANDGSSISLSQAKGRFAFVE